MDWLPLVGGVSTALAAILGAYAALKARRTEGRAADREETQQVLNAQATLLDRYEKRIDKLERKVHSLERKAEDLLVARDEVTAMHRDCTQRLRIAEARILELGG